MMHGNSNIKFKNEIFNRCRRDVACICSEHNRT